MKLTQYFNCIHLAGGYPVEPIDIHASVRHLDAIYDKLTLTDKVVHAYSLGKERVEDAMEMVRIAGGPHARGVRGLAAHVHQHQLLLAAEARLADARRRDAARAARPADDRHALHALRRHGAGDDRRRGGAADRGGALRRSRCCSASVRALPVVYGSFTSNVDMKSGAPAFGTPEYVRATQISGQMARYYGLPLRASNACAANAPDAQAAWESANSLWACITAKANVVYHAAGWLEGGLIASYEKFVIDCETLQQVIHYMKPIGTTDDDIAVEAIARGRAAQPFLRRRAHAGALRDGLLQPVPLRLAELRGVGAAGSIADAAARQPDLEADPRRIRAAPDGPGDRGGARGVRRAPQARGRRADGFLIVTLVSGESMIE